MPFRISFAVQNIIKRRSRLDVMKLSQLIAGVFKDYLRELPEPLFTRHLYQMIVDALSVCMSDDPQGNAKLIFSLLDCLSRVNRVSISEEAELI